MSLIHLEKLPLGEAWRSRVEGHFILGAHPIETVRKGLPEAMAQAVVDHCAIVQEDVVAFVERMMKEISALTYGAVDNIAPPSPPPGWDRTVTPELIAQSARAVSDFEASPHALHETAPRAPPATRRARVPRKAAAVAPEAEPAAIEPADRG